MTGLPIRVRVTTAFALAMRTIAEVHGGSAHAPDRENGGADVWIELPRP